jgi:hypothetical protein
LSEENARLKNELQACLDELDFRNGLVEQLKIENSKKWRVEERNDWKSLVDSVQRDRDEIRKENDFLVARVDDLETELAALKETCSSSAQRQSGSVDVPPSSPSQRLSVTIPEPTTPNSGVATPMGNLRKELHEARARLETERSVLAKERLEAKRLRAELSARRERERWQQGAGLFVKFARLSRIWSRGPTPQLPRSTPVNV